MFLEYIVLSDASLAGKTGMRVERPLMQQRKSMSEYIEPSEFENLLYSLEGEREISSFIKDRPQMLYWSFCRAGGHSRYLFKEFPLGAQYKVDYVILNSYSGVWEVMFIEFEPVDDPVFNKQGTPSKRFAGAIKQIDDWREYYDEHKAEIRSELVHRKP